MGKLFSIYQRITRKFGGNIFSEIYKKNSWGDAESLSGSGSNLLNTAFIRKELPLLFRKLKIQSLLDTPCGDFYWMQHVPLNTMQYTGADIVPELIEKNREQYGNDKKIFEVLNMTKDVLPKSDLILCRDGLVHLSFRDIISSLKNFKNSGSTYLLTTTFPEINKNRDIPTGEWRPINLELKPFNLGKPLETINEKYTGENGLYKDKSLGLWKLNDIRL